MRHAVALHQHLDAFRGVVDGDVRHVRVDRETDDRVLQAVGEEGVWVRLGERFDDAHSSLVMYGNSVKYVAAPAMTSRHAAFSQT